MTNFGTLIQSGFWIVSKITFANLWKPFDDIIIPVLNVTLNLKYEEKMWKNYRNLNILNTRKVFHMK